MSRRPLYDRVLRRLSTQVGGPLQDHVVAPLRARLNAHRTYDPVFVGGASGGGTSFLALSVGQRFDCAGVVYESNLQVGHRSILYVPDLIVFGSVREYQRALEPKPTWSVETARRDLLHMYRGCAWGPSDVVIDKGPDTNLLRAAFLDRCFPKARFVVVYRDPVANVEGLRRKWRTFGEDPLEETIRFYRESHERFLEEAEGFAERTALVDYDALVERYDEALEAIGQRLELRPARRRRRLPTRANVEGQGIRNVRRGQIGVVRDANRRARERLDPTDLQTIHKALEPLHARLRTSALNVLPAAP
jgi:hypothetical protein